MAVELSKNHGITVGRCNIEINQALAARFKIRGIPTLFLLHKGDVWAYEGMLSKEKIKEFAISSFKFKQSLSLWESPLGPIGQFKGLLIRIGVSLLNFPTFISRMSGFSTSSSFSFIFSSIVLGLFALLLTFLFVYLTLPKIKDD